MTSIILAAVICEADEPCSVKTAKAPESSSTMSPRGTTLPLYFWSFGAIPRSSGDRCPSMMQSGLSFLFLCASRMTSFLFRTFSVTSWAPNGQTLRFVPDFRSLNLQQHLTSEFSVFWKRAPFLPGCKRILRWLLVLRNQVVLQWHWGRVLWCRRTLLSAYSTRAWVVLYNARSKTLLLYFWYFSSDSALLRWQMYIREAKWTVLLSFLCNDLLLVNCHRWQLFELFFHFLSNAAFVPGIFIGHENELVHNISMDSMSWTPSEQCEFHDLSVEFFPNALS